MGNVGQITSAAQRDAVAEPHRRAVLRRLMVRPATISQLGRDFGKHPAWVRHHIVVLEKAGLVELAETRTTRNYTEKYYRASAPALAVHELIVPDYDGREHVIALGSNDLALALLAEGSSSEVPDVIPVSIGSLDGLIALRQGLSDIAGCHLLDAASGEYNLPYVRHLFPDRAVSVVTLVHREQGLVVPEGNPKRLSGIEDLARPDVRIVNRNAGSGTRVWIDQRLREAGIPGEAVTGYDTVASTHDEVAEAVELGTADAGIAIRAVAEARGLGFVSLFEERYDLVFAEDRVAQQPVLQEMLGRLEGGAFRKAVKKLPGYGTEETGHVEQLVG